MDDPVGAVSDLWDRLISISKQLAPEDWSRPTPCAAWTVHDLLAHCASVQLEIDGGDVPPVPADWLTADVVPLDRWTAAGVASRTDSTPGELRADLRAAREGHITRLLRVEDWSAGVEAPVGRMSEQALLAMRCFDLWVHLQDLHVALGQPFDVGDPSEAAAAAHGYVLERAGWMLVKRVGAPEGARLRLVLAFPLPADKVVSVRGGRGRLDPTAEPGADEVRAAPEAFTLLAAGRGDASAWRDRGLLDWAGPLAERFVERARLFASATG